MKGRGWLTNSLNSLLAALRACQIKDELLVDDVNDWVKRLNRNYRRGQKIGKKDAKELSKDANRWQDVILKEFLARPCLEYEKGTLNQKALMLTSEGKPSDVFDKDIWRNLPKSAKNDFSDSAKCLLVGASTPAAMVALRGIEAVVRDYYARKTPKDPKRKNLRDIVEEPQGINKKLLSYIDYVRSETRNIAQNPDGIFTKRQAEKIFMKIANVTRDIHAEIPNSD